MKKTMTNKMKMKIDNELAIENPLPDGSSKIRLQQLETLRRTASASRLFFYNSQFVFAKHQQVQWLPQKKGKNTLREQHGNMYYEKETT